MLTQKLSDWLFNFFSTNQNARPRTEYYKKLVDYPTNFSDSIFCVFSTNLFLSFYRFVCWLIQQISTGLNPKAGFRYTLSIIPSSPGRSFFFFTYFVLLCTPNFDFFSVRLFIGIKKFFPAGVALMKIIKHFSAILSPLSV